MHVALAVAELGTILAVIATFLFAMVLPALADQYTPEFLRPLQARIRRIVAPAAHQPALADQPENAEHYEHLAHLYPDVDPVTLLDMAMEEEAAVRAPVTTLQGEPEALAVLLMEVDLYLGFVPKVRGKRVYLSLKQYDRLVDFTAFRYEIIRTPESVFAEQGLSITFLRKPRP